MRTYKKLTNLTINGLSRWIAQCAKDSALFKDKPIINLPNPINTQTYAPIEKHIARTLLHLTQPKKLIAFGAIGGTSIDRKGFKELTIALQCLDDSLKAKCEIIIFGGYTEPLDTITTHNLGFIHDDNTLSLAYNACDVFVTPSLAENLSNAIMESLSCGTPVVGFDIGGNADMITHKYNGYLATQGDSLDLASGIEWVLNLDSSAYTTLSLHARQSAIENFSSKKVAMQYIQAYKKIYKSQMGGGHRQYLIILYTRSFSSSLNNHHNNRPHDYLHYINNQILGSHQCVA